MARVYFNAYHSYLEAIEPLGDAARGRLFTACLRYSMTGEAPELRGNERFVFASMKSQIDRDLKQYEARCETNRKNGSLGGQCKANVRYQTLPIAADGCQTPPKEKETEKETAKDKEKEKGNRADKPRRFTRPAVEEIRAYCRERGNNIDPQRFFDFYEAKGWRVGNQPMQDWQAALRTWEGREPLNTSGGEATGNPFKKRLMELERTVKEGLNHDEG
jgi:hypothetical protein